MTQYLLCPSCERAVAEGDKFCGNCGTPVPSMPPAAGDPARVPAGNALLDAIRKATIGEYEIREELGRGGMAIVYLAHEIRFGRKVALKVLLPQLHLVPGMASRFLREAQMAASLEHPNIIPIYGYRESPDVVFFTMRYIAGVSLSALVKQVRQFPIPLVRAVMADVGHALSFAHRRGVLHRDVKPANVMIGAEGSIYVTDFGIAKQSDGPGLTLTGQLLGTPGYMSPEQCRGRDVSHASDQYSLGTMAFELLTGRPPFSGTNAMDLMLQQMTQPVPDVRSLRADCPPELAAAVTKMLAKESADRFRTIDEALAAARAVSVLPGDPMREMLIRWVESPINARVFAVTPVSLSPRTDADKTLVAPVEPKPRQRAETPKVVSRDGVTAALSSRRVVQIGGAVAGLVLVAVLWTLTQSGGPPPPSPAPEEPPAPAITTGTLAVTGLPEGGRIMIDGVTAAGPRLDLAPGQHRLRLEAPGFYPLDTVVVTTLGTTDSLRFSATPEPAEGTLVVRGLPTGGRILVDGERVRGPNVTLAPGPHEVRLEAPGYSAVDTVMEVQRGSAQALAFSGARLATLEPPVRRTESMPVVSAGTGVLMVRVRPFAQVFIDGRLIVEDEILVRELRSGQHTLRFVKNGFATRDTSFTIGAGDTLRVRVDLQRNPQ